MSYQQVMEVAYDDIVVSCLLVCVFRFSYKHKCQMYEISIIIYVRSVIIISITIIFQDRNNKI